MAGGHSLMWTGLDTASPGANRLWWIPFFVDYGSLPAISFALLWHAARIGSGHRRGRGSEDNATAQEAGMPTREARVEIMPTIGVSSHRTSQDLPRRSRRRDS